MYIGRRGGRMQGMLARLRDIVDNPTATQYSPNLLSHTSVHTYKEAPAHCQCK